MSRPNSDIPDTSVETAVACGSSEERIFLLLHGSLPLAQRLPTLWHLRRCAACRKQLSVLTAASQAFADTMRGEDLPRWSPPISPHSLLRWPLPAVVRAPLTLFFLTALMVLTATVYLRQVNASQLQSASPASLSVGGGGRSCPLHRAAATVAPVEARADCVRSSLERRNDVRKLSAPLRTPR